MCEKKHINSFKIVLTKTNARDNISELRQKQTRQKNLEK